MKLEEQVISLESAKRLKELGVEQESLFYHVRLTDTPDGREHWLIRNTPWGNGCVFEASAFTVAELGEELKKYGFLPNWHASQKQYYYATCNENDDFIFLEYLVRAQMR